MSKPDFGYHTEGNQVAEYFADQVKGRTFLITGPSAGGIGSETVTSLARSHPDTLILVGRSQERCQPAIDEAVKTNPSIKVKFFQADLASLASVRKAAQEILDDTSIPVIDVVINNAAVMACPFELTADGHELQLASSHLGHFVLTNKILPKVLASKAPRIINVSSSGNKAASIRWTDPNFSEQGSYEPWDSYGQAKRANILFSVALNQRYRKTKGLRAFALHPGSVGTNLGKFLTPELVAIAVKRVFGDIPLDQLPPRKTLQQGCSTQVRAALDPTLDIGGDGNQGVFLIDCQQVTTHSFLAPQSVDADDARRLWPWTEELVGERFPVLE